MILPEDKSSAGWHSLLKLGEDLICALRDHDPRWQKAKMIPSELRNGVSFVKAAQAMSSKKVVEGEESSRGCVVVAGKEKPMSVGFPTGTHEKKEAKKGACNGLSHTNLMGMPRLSAA